jgi:hypothetical protein
VIASTTKEAKKIRAMKEIANDIKNKLAESKAQKEEMKRLTEWMPNWGIMNKEMEIERGARCMRRALMTTGCSQGEGGSLMCAGSIRPHEGKRVGRAPTGTRREQLQQRWD